MAACCLTMAIFQVEMHVHNEKPMTSFSSNDQYFQQQFNNQIEADALFNQIEFEDCQFVDCNFSQTEFKHCKFVNCEFVRCNLSLTKIPLSRFTEVTFRECKMVGIDWTRAQWSSYQFHSELKFYKCILNDSSFFGLELHEVVMEECKAHDVDFRDTKLNGASLTYTDFSNSLFGRTNLSGADLSEATNYSIDVLENNLNKATFSRYEALSLLDSLGIKLVD